MHLAEVEGVIIRRDDFPERCRCLKVSAVGIRCRAVVVVVTHAGEERQAVAVVGQRAPEILQTVIVTIPENIPCVVTQYCGVYRHISAFGNGPFGFDTFNKTFAEL